MPAVHESLRVLAWEGKRRKDMGRICQNQMFVVLDM